MGDCNVLCVCISMCRCIYTCLHVKPECECSLQSLFTLYFFETKYPLNLCLMVLTKLAGYFTPSVYFLSPSLNLNKYYPGSLSSGVTDVCSTCCKSELRSSRLTGNHFIDFDFFLVLISLLLNSLLCMYMSQFVYLLSQ